MTVFSAFSVGLFANAVLPGRIGELARVAVMTRKLRLQGRGNGTWAALVGTVFAHRLFDLVPTTLLIVYVVATAKIPHWAIGSLVIVGAVGFALFAFAFMSARHHNRSVLEGVGPVRRLVEMGRFGLAVLHAPGPAAVAALFQTLGWVCQLFAVYVAMRAFDIHAPLPAAALVLLLMNVATLFPLWPGNIGLLQAAIALPLRSVRRPGRAGDRVRLRAAGDRGLGRGRRRADVPRAGGSVVRDAAADARRCRGRGARRRKRGERGARGRVP